MERDLTRQLEELFREASEAHHQAYIETDGADPEWPLWYADYLRDKLALLLDATFTNSELVYMLILLPTSNLSPLRVPIGQVLCQEVPLFVRITWCVSAALNGDSLFLQGMLYP